MKPKNPKTYQPGKSNGGKGKGKGKGKGDGKKRVTFAKDTLNTSSESKKNNNANQKNAQSSKDKIHSMVEKAVKESLSNLQLTTSPLALPSSSSQQGNGQGAPGQSQLVLPSESGEFPQHGVFLRLQRTGRGQ